MFAKLWICGSGWKRHRVRAATPPPALRGRDWWSIGRDCCGAPHYYSWLQGVTSSHKLMPTIEQGPFPQLLCCFHCEFETSMVPSAYPLVVPPAVLDNLQQNRYIYINNIFLVITCDNHFAVSNLHQRYLSHLTHAAPARRGTAKYLGSISSGGWPWISWISWDQTWLVGGLNLPSWKIWLRQLGRMTSHIRHGKKMFETTNQVEFNATSMETWPFGECLAGF